MAASLPAALWRLGVLDHLASRQAVSAEPQDPNPEARGKPFFHQMFHFPSAARYHSQPMMNQSRTTPKLSAKFRSGARRDRQPTTPRTTVRYDRDPTGSVNS
jgi:hypothetical protein